jgi:alpha-1,2-mannosyltransferase
MLHSFVGEHFGIAIIEAMSAGVIPVTHDSGAAKVDGLVPESYRYQDLNSAVGKVTSALSSWDLNVAEKLREFAKGFSADSFRENLKRFLLDWINRHQ